MFLFFSVVIRLSLKSRGNNLDFTSTSCNGWFDSIPRTNLRLDVHLKSLKRFHQSFLNNNPKRVNMEGTSSTPSKCKISEKW